MNAYAVAYQNNFYQLDEIREREDLPPLGFNFIKLGLYAVLVDPETKEIYTPNTGKLEQMNASGHLTDNDLTNDDIRAIIEERFNDNHDPKSGRFTSGSSKMSAPGQKPPDFDKYPVKEDLASVESVKQQMIEQLGIAEKDIDLTGIKNAEVLQPFVDRLKIIKDETGMKIPSIVATELYDGDECCISAYSRGENRIYISSKYFNSKEATLDAMNSWADNKVFPDKARTIKFLAEHETAHARITEEEVRTVKASRIHKRFLGTAYANKNDRDVDEFFADSEAYYRLFGNKAPKEMKEAALYLRKGDERNDG